MSMRCRNKSAYKSYHVLQGVFRSQDSLESISERGFRIFYLTVVSLAAVEIKLSIKLHQASKALGGNASPKAVRIQRWDWEVSARHLVLGVKCFCVIFLDIVDLVPSASLSLDL